jgi:hypothetical protein
MVNFNSAKGIVQDGFCRPDDESLDTEAHLFYRKDKPMSLENEEQNSSSVTTESPRPAQISLARAAELFGVDDPPFTAGPWEASGENGVHKGIRAIAITHGDDRTANARAIAALPTLYQALEVINVLACYTQENQNARDEMLLNIGSIAREATAALNNPA